MFLALGIAWALTTSLCLWLLWQLVRLVRYVRSRGNITIQVLTAEERLQEEAFVEYARQRAKEIYISLGEV